MPIYYERTTLAKVDNQYCVKYECSSFGKPEIVTLHWPISDLRRNVGMLRGMPMAIEDCIGHVLRSGSNSEYHDDEGALTFYMTNGGQTKSIKTEVRPCPCPKTRCETRWYQGEWQKYLKTKGWVTA